jgi:hypothetical protein
MVVADRFVTTRRSVTGEQRCRSGVREGDAFVGSYVDEFVDEFVD